MFELFILISTLFLAFFVIRSFIKRRKFGKRIIVIETNIFSNVILVLFWTYLQLDNWKRFLDNLNGDKIYLNYNDDFFISFSVKHVYYECYILFIMTLFLMLAMISILLIAKIQDRGIVDRFNTYAWNEIKSYKLEKDFDNNKIIIECYKKPFWKKSNIYKIRIPNKKVGAVEKILKEKINVSEAPNVI